jgi:ATP-binding cassette subfamily F protein uup
MDRLVEHLFVFEGEGQIRDFPGNYSDLREWDKTQKSVEKESKATPTPLPKKEVELSASTVKTKASFKEKQEFEDLNKKLVDRAKEKETLVQLINGGTENHEKVLEWSVNIQALDADIEALELRWLELSELDGIG